MEVVEYTLDTKNSKVPKLLSLALLHRTCLPQASSKPGKSPLLRSTLGFDMSDKGLIESLILKKIKMILTSIELAEWK